MNLTDIAFAKQMLGSGGGGGGSATPFIVTLTPTAQDFSGTMDKTIAEINDAYLANRKIVFRIIADVDGSYMEVECAARWKSAQNTYPSFNGFMINDEQDLLVFAWTGATDNGARNTYGTSIFPLTQLQ